MNEPQATIDVLPSRCLEKQVSNSPSCSSRPSSASPAPFSLASITSSASSSVIAHQSKGSVGSIAVVAQDVNIDVIKNSSIVSKVQTDVRPKKARARKVDRKWMCGACQGDVRIPPLAPVMTDCVGIGNTNTPLSGDALVLVNSTKCEGEADQEEEYLSTNEALHLTTAMCALKCCPIPRYHLKCSGVPIGSQIFRNSIISYEVSANQNRAISANDSAVKKIYDAKRILEDIYSSSEAVWWDVLPETNILNSKHQRSQQSLQNDKNWPTSMASFMCPNCDVEGTSRYLLEYFEQFHSMKTSFYEDYLSESNIVDAGNRLDRADESTDSRTGEAFLWHLMKNNRKDYLRRKQAEGNAFCCVIDWNPSEIRLKNMARVLTHLSKQIQQQQHQRRQKRQKNKFQLDPSYLVGMPIRLYNPIDKTHHSGRVIDYKVNAPYQVDEPVSKFNPSTSPEASAAPDIGQLTDGKICNTLFLIRFRKGTEGRKIAVHQWIYLEEHAVSIGGEVCWAHVGDQPVDPKAGNTNEKKSNVGKVKLSSQGSGTHVLKSDIKLQAQNEEYASHYRPVQIIFRSMLEMVPLQNLNPCVSRAKSTKPCTSVNGEECRNKICCLNILAMGFGQAFSHIRLSFSDSGMNTAKANSEGAKDHVNQSSTVAELNRPAVIPLTSNNPSWINRILHRAQLSDEDVALALAMACMEKEEERRIRLWRNLSVSHLTQPSFTKRNCTVISAASPSTASSPEPKKPAVKCTTPSQKSPPTLKRLDLQNDVSLEFAASGCGKCRKELKTGKKSHRSHDVNCPRKRTVYPVSLEVAASFGCAKCKKELRTGKKSRSSHDKNCPRRRNSKGGTFKEESIQPSPIADNSLPPLSEQIEHVTSTQENKSPPTKKRKVMKSKFSPTEKTMANLKQYVRTPDPRPSFGCQWCGPTLKNKENTVCTTCQLLQADGWSLKQYVESRKRCFSNPEGEKLWCIKDFLSVSTEDVVRKMTTDPPK